MRMLTNTVPLCRRPVVNFNKNEVGYLSIENENRARDSTKKPRQSVNIVVYISRDGGNFR